MQHASFDPAALEEKLPDVPLKEADADALAEALDCSINKITFETDGGTEVVPMATLFAHSDDRKGEGADPAEIRGDALAMYFDEDDTEWFVELEREDITLKEWMKANELYGQAAGMKRGESTLTLDINGEEVTRNLR